MRITAEVEMPDGKLFSLTVEVDPEMGLTRGGMAYVYERMARKVIEAATS